MSPMTLRLGWVAICRTSLTFTCTVHVRSSFWKLPLCAFLNILSLSLHHNLVNNRSTIASGKMADKWRDERAATLKK
jgi:hypothetical protein